MEYLNRVLGIRVMYPDEALKSMPNYIRARYKIHAVTLDGKKTLFVYPKTELEAISAIKKHLETIREVQGAPAVLVPDHLTYRQKEYLLRDRIPFIVEGRQIYLPFMAVYLQERGDAEAQEIKTVLPSAQLLLLYFIYQGCGELLTSEAVQKLALTATSISRASRQLEEMGLIKTEKRGVQKAIFTEKTPEELFNSAKNRLCDPVKRTIYVSKSEVHTELLKSGYSALAEYSMLNPSAVEYYAADSITVWEKKASEKLQSTEDQCAVQLWRYDPKILAADGCVDRLSLALALRDDKDVRVEEAVEEMLAQVWRDIDGKGD